MPPIIKYLVVFALIAIIYNLFRAFYHLTSRKSAPKEVIKSLMVRVGLSIALFLSLLLAAQFGIIKPHGLIPTTQTTEQQPSINQE